MDVPVTAPHRANAMGLLVGLLMIGIGYANNGPSLDPPLAIIQVATVPEGFGADTVGGDQGNVCHVTTLDDQFLNDPVLGWGSGPPGTLRYCTFDALVRPCNNPSCGTKVVFDVAGTIRLTRKLLINASYVTIDGSDAPDPGITLDGTHIEHFQPAIQIRSNHDVIVKHIRIHKYSNYEWKAGMSDGLDLIDTHNVLIDHVSVYNPGDEAMIISSGTNAGIPSGYAHDITVQHSIFAYTYTGTHPTTSGIMIEYDPINNVSLHHNYIYNFKRRSPKFGTGGHYDFRNNVIAHADGWSDEGGTRLIAEQGVNATGNILKNVYNANYGTAIRVEDNALWHISGNIYNGDTSFDDSLSRHAEYTNVPAIMTLEVTEVQGHVFGCAGAFPRDWADQDLVGPPSQACVVLVPDSGGTDLRNQRER